MTLQSSLTFALVALAALYFCRDLFRSLFRPRLSPAPNAPCASGCGSCTSGGCPVNKPN